MRLSAGGSHGSSHAWPSMYLVECSADSQNWLAMADRLPRLLDSFSGTTGIVGPISRALGIE